MHTCHCNSTTSPPALHTRVWDHVSAQCGWVRKAGEVAGRHSGRTKACIRVGSPTHITKMFSKRYHCGRAKTQSLERGASANAYLGPHRTICIMHWPRAKRKRDGGYHSPHPSRGHGRERKAADSMPTTHLRILICRSAHSFGAGEEACEAAQQISRARLCSVQHAAVRT